MNQHNNNQEGTDTCDRVKWPPKHDPKQEKPNVKE